MTNREFFNAVKDNKVNNEVMEFASAALVKMDERLAKRNAKPSKTAVANEPIKAEIVAFITKRNELCIAPAVAEALSISVQKASALLRQLAENGVLTREEVKVPKKGKMLAYGIAK